MAEQRVGILIEAIDKASSVLKGIGKAGKQGFDGVRSAVNKVPAALAKVGFAFVALEQTLSVVDRLMSVFNRAITDNVAAMVEYRRETDPVARQFRKLGDEAKYTRAVIGDLFTPAILGFKNALDNTGLSLSDYINKNRELIQTNIIEFLAEAGRVLTQVVGEGLIWVSRAVSGLIEVWHLLSAAVEAAIGGSVRGVEGMLRAFAAVFEWAGKRDLAQSLEETADTAALLGDTFLSSADKSIGAMEAQVAAQEELEDGIRSAQAAAVEFANVAEKGMLDLVGATGKVIRGVREEHDAKVRALKAEFAMLDQLAAMREANEQRRRAFIDQIRAEHQSAEKAAKSYGDSLIGVFSRASEQHSLLIDKFRSGKITLKEFEQGLANIAKVGVESAAAVGDAFGQQIIMMAAEGKRLDEIMGHIGRSMLASVVDFVEKAIIAYAAEAAAAQLAAHSYLGFVGIAIGAAAAATMAGMVKALLTDVPRAATGGVFRTQTIAQVGERGPERVLSPRQTTAFERLVDRLDRGGGVAGGTNLNVNLTVQALDVQSPETHKRVMLTLAPAVEELVRDGMLKVSPGGV